MNQVAPPEALIGNQSGLIRVQMMYAVHPNPLEWPPWASVPQNQEVFQPLGSLKTAVGDKAVKTQRILQAPLPSGER